MRNQTEFAIYLLFSNSYLFAANTYRDYYYSFSLNEYLDKFRTEDFFHHSRPRHTRIYLTNLFRTNGDYLLENVKNVLVSYFYYKS